MNGRELIIGVTGGVAAFKTAALVSQLVQAGAGVTVVMTAAAERFVGRTTFAALTGRKVVTELFDDAEFPLGSHIALAERAELLCIAPATANFLAESAIGLANDVLGTLMLSFRGPVMLAPAMNSAMWAKPSTQRNVAQLRADGIKIIDPEEGWLSCRQVGAGRMAAPDRILYNIIETLTTTPGSPRSD